MKMYFFFNPKSGRANVKNNLATIIDIFVKAGYEVVVHPTQEKDDAKNRIKELSSRYDTVVVSGGDGTINEAISAFMNIPKAKRPCLGYIPCGTANDFATNLNIPKNNAPKAAYNIVNGEPKEIDIGKIGDRYFSYIAAFGAFTEVSYETPQQIKNILGYLAYLLEGIKRLGNIKPYKMKVKYDDKVIEDEFIFGMVSNSYSVGGRVLYNDDMNVSLDDGIFECILVKNPTNAIDLQFTIADLLTNNLKSEKFIFVKTSKITFECDETVDWTVDGEFGGNFKNVTVSNKKQEIKILIDDK